MAHSNASHAGKRTRKSSHHQAQSDTAPRGRHELCIPLTVGEMSCKSCPCPKCTHTTQLWRQTRLQSPQCSPTKNTLIWSHQIYPSQHHHLQQRRQGLLWQDHSLHRSHGQWTPWNATNSLSLHAGYYSRDEILYMHSSQSFSRILHIHPFCSYSSCAPRQRRSALYMAQHKLRPASRTQ